MKTEQDIRRFMQENRIPVPKDAAFMNDLIRQINLLPTPASLTRDDEKIQENLRMVKTILDSIRKHNRKQALILVLVNMILSMAIFTAGYFLFAHEVITYILMGSACLVVLAVTVCFTDLVRI